MASWPVGVDEYAVVWARRMRLITDEAEEHRLGAMKLEQFAARILPWADSGDVALTAQWAAFVCLVDDDFDRSEPDWSPEEILMVVGRLVRVLDPWPPVASTSAEAALADLWARTVVGMPESWRERFVTDYADFALASCQEASMRRAEASPTLDAYMELRRRTITLLPVADVLECTGHALMPESPMVRARLLALRLAAADVAGWSNDLVSADADRVRGQDNLITVLSRERGCQVDAARAEATAMRDARLQDFHALAAALRDDEQVPSGEREQLARYIAVLRSFLEATLHWLGVTGRFEARWLTDRIVSTPDTIIT